MIRGTSVDEYERYCNRESPIKGLPPLIAEAVNEVQKNTKAPLEMVISSALAVVSLVCQNEINEINVTNVDPNGQDKPCSLFLLTIGESGERKSTVDSYFTDTITEFVKQKDIEYKKKLVEHNSRMDLWKNKNKAILSCITKAIKQGENYDHLDSCFIEHNNNKPFSPKKFRLIYANATPQAILEGLHKDWPSGGIISDEAGDILNGHAMKDLGMLNVLWDGGHLDYSRKTSESFTLKDARLTIGLMTQVKSLQKFINHNGGLARDKGFLSRFLVSYPLSTKGKRFRKLNENIEINNNLNAFKERINSILNAHSETDSSIDHKKVTINLSPEANKLWNEYHNETEIELKTGNRLSSVDDAASKIAANARRLAAIFHYFEGRKGSISERSMEEAIVSCEIYMNNFLDMFGEYGIFSPEKEDVDKLVKYLKSKIDDRKFYLKKNEILQIGPIRNNVLDLNNALDYLCREGAVNLRHEGRTQMVQLNVDNYLFGYNDQALRIII